MNFQEYYYNYLLDASRKMTESFISGKKFNFGIESFYMFSISKFILLKEKIIKKDSSERTIYFDDIKYRKYIPIILMIYNVMLKNGNIRFNNINVKLESNQNNNQLKNAVWFINKLRNSLAHGNYFIDIENQCVVIHSKSVDEDYYLHCTLPLSLLNTFSFYVDRPSSIEINSKSAYQKYIKNISDDFAVDYNLVCNNPFITSDKDTNSIINNKKIYYKQYNDRLSNENVEDMKNNINMNIEELRILANKLLSLKPTNEYQKKAILGLLERYKKLLVNYKYQESNKSYSYEVAKLIKEMREILGVKTINKNGSGAVSLYNYMSLLFSKKRDIDYSKLRTDKLAIISENDTYKDTVRMISLQCKIFNKNIVHLINKYNSDKSVQIRQLIMENIAIFYTETMKYFYRKNEYVVTSIRNAVDHGHYNMEDSSEIILHDQSNQNDSSTINFACKSGIKDLFDFAKQVESNKKVFTLADFINQLESVVDCNVFQNTINNLKEAMTIVFGNELNKNISMEEMFRSLAANKIIQIANKEIEKKARG